jgi:hypothetical protein
LKGGHGPTTGETKCYTCLAVIHLFLSPKAPMVWAPWVLPKHFYSFIFSFTIPVPQSSPKLVTNLTH